MLIRKIIAYVPAHVLYHLGDWISYPTFQWNGFHWLYPTYNWLMQRSCELSDWADLGIWKPVEEEE